ncbi:hypothetical protein KC367_g4254 [Hortaea werneckii]|uniref:cutinase n=2 Tax=Hortaea werneckii TaxID=91943 RepID=A0A3M7ISV5_HORWE|nr:hypothetical protein KC342_g2689 [Hortaea werneckii]OTA24149.1 hypothetical protein BTJ68_12600 [Hortaea werneckii EXF-2000]KAI6848314.1 hypothetical protein KC358_g1855 [Hortaea werneckii]KAI6851464.1 hypothetical protein KC350_g1637 [Hortaea werneckii]KAI6944774.1 hypothetical protein KC341_g595 [Hortaea werneckii]
MRLSANLTYLVYAASVALAVPVEKRASTSYSGGSTATDVADGVCAPVTFIFARGSTETGNMGSTVGPALAKALISALGSDRVAIQGVEYPATIESNISMGSEGGPEMAKLAQQALSNCPNTKIALSGYSQGATVTHYAVKSGGLNADSVSAVVLYGDPLYGQSVGDLPDSKLKEFCASGDGVCETGTFSISAAHLSYTSGSDISEGAEFIESNIGASSGTSSSSEPSSTEPSSSSSTSTESGSSPGLGSFFGSSSNNGLSGLTGF